jgi:hypothetical protein
MSMCSMVGSWLPGQVSAWSTSQVLGIYKAPSNAYPHCERPRREGSRETLNALELDFVAPIEIMTIGR